MVQKAADLQQLKSVGTVLAQRMVKAGLDSFAKIAQAGEEDLKKVRGISPRAIGSILEQAKQLSEPQQQDAERGEAVKKQLSEVREKIQILAQIARERFHEELSGKVGKKLSSDLIRIENALVGISDGGSKRCKRTGKALVKVEKRVTGLEGASLKKLRKRLKRARKTVLKVLR